MEKLNFRKEKIDDMDVIYVNIAGYEICYNMQVEHDYTGGCFGAATMREYYENIENEERSTHFLYLKDSEWTKIIHGYVPFEFYKNADELIMRFTFSGMGTSQYIRPTGEKDVVLGKVILTDIELKLITDDGKEYIYPKVS